LTGFLLFQEQKLKAYVVFASKKATDFGSLLFQTKQKQKALFRFAQGDPMSFLLRRTNAFASFLEKKNYQYIE
jgi:hypothetical protein